MIKDRELYINKAKQHNIEMNAEYSKQINASYKGIKVYTDKECMDINNTNLNRYTNITCMQSDNILGAIKEYKNDSKCNGKTAVIIPGCIKSPGEFYLKGFMEDEDAVCHVSNLYNILKKFDENNYNFFKKENYNINSEFKDSCTGLYIPNVIFEPMDESIYKLNVIWVPPIDIGLIYRCNKKISNAKIDKCQFIRLALAFFIAVKHKVDNIILSDFGCGRYLNDPYNVAFEIRYFLRESLAGAFKNVIMSTSNVNIYNIFTDVLNNDEDMEDNDG